MLGAPSGGRVHRLVPVGLGALEGLLRLAGEGRAPDRESRAVNRSLAHPLVPPPASISVFASSSPSLTQAMA
jgi:hypothetical protein